MTKRIEFAYMSAQNFLPFGPEGIEVRFDHYGNIVLVTGVNRDISEGENVENYRNGIGKSSIAEILVYTLFGKSIKKQGKLSQKDVINNITKRGLRTEVRWGDFRVVRTRKPDSLELWKKHAGPADESKIAIIDGERYLDISVGGIPATQAEIEKELGINYQTFVNLVVFTDDLTNNFLECDAATKRAIVENLLGLERYRAYAETAKKFRNTHKEKQKELLRDYERSVSDLELCTQRRDRIISEEATWKSGITSQIAALRSSLRACEDQLASFDGGNEILAYNKSREDLAANEAKLAEVEKETTSCEQFIRTANEHSLVISNQIKDLDSQIRAKSNEVEQFNQSIASLNYNISNYKRDIESLTAKINRCGADIEVLAKSKGAKCDKCHGDIGDANIEYYKQEKQKEALGYLDEINALKAKIVELEAQMTPFQEKIAAITPGIEELRNSLVESEGKSCQYTTALRDLESKRSGFTAQAQSLRFEIQRLSKIPAPQAEMQVQLLAQKIEQTKQQIADKEREGSVSPYVAILKSCTDEIVAAESNRNQKKAEAEEAADKLPYYEYWCKAFGDAGIRKFIIDRIIPGLNDRVAHWMQHLIGGKLRLAFDNELNETITRIPNNGDPFVYDTMSGGERRRLNLSVSQAFANVALASAGRTPSVVFLDEVTLNVDESGILGIYRMIQELAADRQVFVTTHDRSLLDLLQGCEQLNLEKRGGFSRLIRK